MGLGKSHEEVSKVSGGGRRSPKVVGETLGYVGGDLMGGALKEVSGVLKM